MTSTSPIKPPIQPGPRSYYSGSYTRRQILVLVVFNAGSVAGIAVGFGGAAAALFLVALALGIVIGAAR